MINDPHHDHQNENMKATTPIRTGFCPLCFYTEGSHSRDCAYRTMTGAVYDVDGIKHNQFPDGKYLVQTRRGQHIGVYINNDYDGGKPYLSVTFDDDTREIDPRDIARIARIVEV